MTRQTKLDTDTDSIDTPVSRRNLLRASGAAAGIAAGGVGSQIYAVEEAEAIAATTAIGLSVAGGAVLGYLINEGVDNVTGPDFDSAAYQDATAEETHIGIYNSAANAAAANDTVITTISNRLADSENVSWAKAKVAAVDAFDQGKDKATAKSKANTAINEYYSVLQKNLANHYTSQCNKFGSWVSRINNTASLSYGNVINFATYAGNASGPVSKTTSSVTLLNGANLTYSMLTSEGTNGESHKFRITGVSNNSSDYLHTFNIQPHSNQEASELLHIVGYDANNFTSRFATLWNDITAKASTMKTNASNYIDDLYANADPGSFDPSQVYDPTTVASQMGTKEETTGSYAYAGAEAAMLGWKSTYNELMTIYLAEDDTTVSGQLYFQGGPQGGVEVGTLYLPSQFTGPVYMAYDTSDAPADRATDYSTNTESSAFVQVEQGFKVKSAEKPNGESVDVVQGETYNNQTSEVGVTQEQLARITEALTDAKAKQEAAAKDESGGGSGSLLGAYSGDNNLLYYGLGAAALLYLFGGD